MSDVTSVATVDTERAARYGKQLVSHLGRKAVGAWDDATASGTLVMGDGTAHVSLTSSPSALHIEIRAKDTIEIFEDVVGSHLQRFGERDDLTVEWFRGRVVATRSLVERL